MEHVLALAQRIAPCDVNALITGETGTGKELLARAIHGLSLRAQGPFVAFSCANLPETLIDDELFGHERGAFTGAVVARRGRFEAAHGGTLFLDEIGDLALSLQAKLLRVVQQRSFERLGGNNTISVNVRLLCATHRDLQSMVKQGTFREDLYYRLNVVQLHLPPLRERRDAIAVLARHFLQQYAEQFGKPVMRFSELALRSLEEFDWPGNVRQLENMVQRAVVLAEGPVVDVKHFPAAVLKTGNPAPAPTSYDDEVKKFKRRSILRTLQECGGNKAETARTLGLARGYLHRLINDLDIRTADPGPDS
jgi:DNA-binding NtrC family response regulator